MGFYIYMAFLSLPSGQGIIVALAVEGASGLGGGEEAVDFVLVQVHHAVVFVVLFVVVVIPAGFAVVLGHILTSAYSDSLPHRRA